MSHDLRLNYIVKSQIAYIMILRFIKKPLINIKQTETDLNTKCIQYTIERANYLI